MIPALHTASRLGYQQVGRCVAGLRLQSCKIELYVRYGLASSRHHKLLLITSSYIKSILSLLSALNKPHCRQSSYSSSLYSYEPICTPYDMATMDENAVRSLVSTVNLISANLDARPESWREQLQAIRSTTRSLEIRDGTPEEAQKRWQIPLITVFQRVAFADADNGAVQDVADWCLRQALALLHLYPEDVEILTRM
jgi:hypothetical protein